MTREGTGSAASRRRAAGAGAVAAGSTLAAAQLGASLIPAATSPVLGVASLVIAATPPRLREVLVGSAGTADKPLLLAGVTVAVLGLGAVVGVRARDSRAAGRVGVLALAAAALLASLSRPGVAVAPTVLVVVAAAVLGTAVLELLLAPRRQPVGAAGRRALLVRTGGVLVGSAAAVAASRFLVAARSVQSVRAAVSLPRPGRRAAELPAGGGAAAPGRTPLVTSNARFYTIDTTLGGYPQVDPAGWSLDLGGLVDRPRRFSYDDLLALPQVEAWITLGCVGNNVGGNLVGTARWQGVLLADLLRAAGPHPAAAQVALTSVDGYTGSFGLASALDGRDAMVAIGMNGEPLPIAHGFPARLVVPGLYGYESAVKWLSRIDLVDNDFQAFWVQRGYAKEAVFRTQSRVDVPVDGRPVRRDADGTVLVAGMAWAPHRGLSRVEVSTDGGPWRPAELAPDLLGPDAWRPWSWRWQAATGTHTLSVRATDGRGLTQPGQPRGVLPDGATGWHTVVVVVG